MLIILDNPRGTQTLWHVLVMVKHVSHVKQVMWRFQIGTYVNQNQ
jgi:hypothetical protein